MTATQDLRNHLRRDHDHEPARTATHADMATWHVEAHDRRGSVYHTRHRGDEAYATPPCSADTGGEVDKGHLLVNLAEAVHAFHDDQPEDWRACSDTTCVRVQEAVIQ